MDPTLHVESLLAVRDKDGNRLVPRGVYGGRFNDKLEQPALCYLTALASICAADSDKEFAAAVYELNSTYTVAFSGYGPIPSTVSDFIEGKIYPILASIASTPEEETVWVVNTKDLLAQIISFTLHRWVSRMYLASIDIWDRRVAATRAKNLRSAAMFEKFVELLVDLKRLAHEFLRNPDRIRNGDELFAQFMKSGRALYSLCRSPKPVKEFIDMIDEIDEDTFLTSAVRRLIHSAFPIVVDMASLEDECGVLKEDFSFLRYAMNIISYFQFTLDLVRMARSYSAVLRSGSLRFEWCTSKQQDVLIDAGRALKVCNLDSHYTAPERSSTKVYLHPVINIVQHLLSLAAANPTCDMIRVIGSSCLCCAGCQTFLRQFMFLRQQLHSVTRNVPNSFGVVGASNVFVNWAFPSDLFLNTGDNENFRLEMFHDTVMTLRKIAKIPEPKYLEEWYSNEKDRIDGLPYQCADDTPCSRAQREH